MRELLPSVVYLLCALTSLICALLMMRSYRSERRRLLLVVGLSFAGLAANNVLLALDLVVFTERDLSVVRSAIGLASTALLLFALIWEAGS
jgi:hypothetical protein